MNLEVFNYKNKVCVVTGASSGMGKATAELLVKLGAEVYALDIQKVSTEGIKAYIPVDLRKQESIDEAFARVPSHVDCFFGVAGIMGAAMPFMDVAKINLVSNKYICKEVLPARMGKGGAVVIVSSAAGIGWEKDGNKKFYEEAINAEGWDATCYAIEATGMTRTNGGFAYVYSKLAANLLVSSLVGFLGKKGIRVNALLPGYTATNFGSESGIMVESGETTSPYSGYAGRAANPAEMAYPLLFLNSDMASYVSGTFIFSDFGACCEMMAGVRPNPVGDSIEANMK